MDETFQKPISLLSLHSSPPEVTATVPSEVTATVPALNSFRDQYIHPNVKNTPSLRPRIH